MTGGDPAAGTAVLSADGSYRYRLTRTWGHGARVVWIMLNPSTADAEHDDPTVRRVAGFSRGWGMAGAVIVNLFALRSASPAVLRDHPDPVGEGNDWHIAAAIRQSRAALVVAAWGAHPAATTPDRCGDIRAEVVLGNLSADGYTVRCLGLTRSGQPRHPLYVRAGTPLRRLPVPAALEGGWW